MFIILSGAYVGSELEAEFGRIPPSLLPLGNKRLFRHQVALAPDGVDVFISLPDSYELSKVDKNWLDKHNVGVLSVPDNLTLGASLVAALNISGSSLNKPLHVLYGDTLYKSLPIGDDIVSVSKNHGSYSRASFVESESSWIEQNNEQIRTTENRIIDGYFKFSKPRELIKCITQSEWDLIDGLNRYDKRIGLSQIESISWLDFGHVNTYYHSKAEFTTQRAFNELTINSRWVEKSSVKDSKIDAEANWFSKIPHEMKGYTPQYLGVDYAESKVSYRLEYLHLTALNELFVFSKLPNIIWEKILLNCVEFLSVCKKYKGVEKNSLNSLDQLFYKKTTQRLDEYCKENQLSLDKVWRFNDLEPVSLKQILNESNRHLPRGSAEESVLHGDFCFSNILYDFRADKIKTIDPRGINPEGHKTIYGDIKYDIAKLSHSILGLYDWVIAGYYDVDINNDIIKFVIHDDGAHKDTQQKFIEIVNQTFNLSAKHLYAMQIQLFLSMLPLHADDPIRQKALFANAFRLYGILMRLEN
ncbi:Capsular biosynthesis protein [Vibrio crassostreae]|uniref:capsular biosynthesis protein n=1 Tax=Vibrio crassostreae TaxID=246167 RepID=UPI001B30B9EE|nr:capsular biosynthesis protein [Vibrio crassostreae]CAK2024997.1 Capsular biosynthesis protein [Vibrio crassostreae]CAK2026914.1 Capsular biosynthesis protein [Vibrio crassostreae]CAK2028741.1 Capsular biosynthesis protein [Vibrio crassostreae]CAK2030071.1 Capsular biosynthesis protein [Vibrio crassostreae]CAK2035274.1 Capsular biosynthesis protein [Vibrio crassostreae]